MARTYGINAVPTPTGALPGDRKVDGRFISEEACDRVRRYTTAIKVNILEGIQTLRFDGRGYRDGVIEPPPHLPRMIEVFSKVKPDEVEAVAYFEQILPNGDACYTTIPNADGACRSFIRVATG